MGQTNQKTRMPHQVEDTSSVTNLLRQQSVLSSSATAFHVRRLASGRRGGDGSPGSVPGSIPASTICCLCSFLLGRVAGVRAVARAIQWSGERASTVGLGTPAHQQDFFREASPRIRLAVSAGRVDHCAQRSAAQE